MNRYVAAVMAGSVAGIILGAATLWFTIEITDGSLDGRKLWVTG
jgi:hypothetical protein